MDNSEAIDIIIESDSRDGEFYSVNIKSLTCSCPHFHKKLHFLSLEDPHRLCKHLIKALSMNGIPENLNQYKEDIDWFANRNSAFTNRQKALTKKWDKRFPLPDGSISTISSAKKKKYCYAEGVGDEKKIMATISLAGGAVSYKINNFHGSYDLNTGTSRIPWDYRYMEQAVINWIVDEYNKVKNTNAKTVTTKTIEYKPNPDPIPEGSIRTISLEKHDPSSGFLILPDGVMEELKDGEEYYYIIGEVDSYKIDAFISSKAQIFYSINGSKCYGFNINHPPAKTIKNIDPTVPTVIIELDMDDKFPKRYLFMERAVTEWLTDEYNKILKKG